MSYQQPPEDEALAYGEDYSQSRGPGGQYGQPGQTGQTGDRGFIGDTFKKLKSRYDQHQQSSSQNYGYSSSGSNQGYYGQQGPNTGYANVGQSAYQGGPPIQKPQQKPDLATGMLGALHGTIQSIGSDVGKILGTEYNPQGQQAGPRPTSGYSGQYSAPPQQGGEHRYDSFAVVKGGNDVKWYVDGCGYFWAVSRALEEARESIWILDWWLSPEVYLRRPPSQNEQWRLDRVLQRAANRGVKVNIIVYKEVTQALTRKYISPTMPKYIHSLLPSSTDIWTSTLVKLGLEATAMSLEYTESEYPLIEFLSVSSAHTKHALEALSPNIAVFRHPDHLPDGQTTQSSLTSAFEGLKLNAAGISKLGRDALKGIYGITDDIILYWAHHEKLCLIDGRTAFMGGLDLCFGRWDTNQHSIADAHPENLDLIAIPGQDYNNARIMDFNDVDHPFQNKLDRTKSSRMGWSDIAVSLHGPCTDDLRHHFIDRWNFIYAEKYNVRKDTRYGPLPDPYTHDAHMQLPLPPKTSGGPQQPQMAQGQPNLPMTGQQPPYGQQSSPAYGSQQQQQQQQQQPYGQTYGPPPGSQPYTQPAWQSTSRPHTPNALNPQPQQQQQAQSPGYGQNTQLGVQQHYPPPPLGPPPQGQAQQYPTSQSYSPAPQNQPTSYDASQPQPQSQPQTQPQSQPPSQSGQPSYGAFQPHPSTQPGQEHYTAYQGSAELPATQSTSPPYQQPGYQPSSGTRGLDESQGYHSYEQGYGTEHGYQGQQRGFDDGQEYGSSRGYTDDYSGERAFGGGSGGAFGKFKGEGKRFERELGSFGNMLAGGLQQKAGKYLGGSSSRFSQNYGPMQCQILRSCTNWSNGTPTEKSIQTAYIDVIEKSQHFVYIENQFFITATGDQQHPVKNLIGKALLDRILRAARNNEKYKVVVVIPSVPGFAGDLRDDSSLGTRAIMEFQYNSINRGEYSIMKQINLAGFNPLEYIRFYNLRNYDRINAGRIMSQVEQQSGIRYEDARKQHDDMVGAGYGTVGEGTGLGPGVAGNQYQQYQATAQQYNKGAAGRWDSVAECYMLGGEDIRNVPWTGTPESELDAFVSEELYIHSKCLIADDRVVICGSANLNDRSQLGYHDSEIAILIDDPTPCQSSMNGRPWQASRFAASLRRQLFRKHLGLLRPQDMTRPDANFEPVGIPNSYDWGSPEDNLVTDPLSDTFLAFWNTRARTNTAVFHKAFHVVPDDDVHTWDDYKEFYEYYFHGADAQAESKNPADKTPARVAYGHVIKNDFPGGARELKELLSTVKGTLVEMPLTFLSSEDIAQQGLTLNAWTEEVYT